MVQRAVALPNFFEETRGALGFSGEASSVEQQVMVTLELSVQAEANQRSSENTRPEDL